ncbi:MAG: glycosyltransferase family 4 protein [Patescibacteria group bacterium]|nr:glycosyltransferase family 4 protein [Patescibacteria group bacterium]
MKKILYCISDNQFGGGSYHVLKLLENIDRKRFTPILVSKNSDIASRLSKKTKCYILPLKNRVDSASINKLREIITKEKPDLIHLHSTRAGILGTMAAKDFQIPIVYTEHLFTASYVPKNKIIYWMQKTAFKKISSHINCVIAVSGSVKEYLLKENIFPNKKVVVIYNGVEIPKIPKRKNHNQITVGSIGSLSVIKGYNYLIEALGLIKKAYPKIYHKLKIKLIGRGEEKANVIQLAKTLGVIDKINIIDYQGNIDEELFALDIYAQPSLSESFGLAVAEAMAHKLPVIVSKVGGLTEIVDDKTGIMIEPKNQKQIAHAIIKLAGNNQLSEKLATNARQKIIKYFSLTKMIRETEKIYAELT